MNKMLKLKRWALLGATDDTTKFGYKIFRLLEDKGYTVYGINPKYDSIDGIKVYKSIDELPEVIEGVNIIVNPKIALDALPKIKAKGIKNVWFQPGSFNDEVIEKAKELGFNIEVENCMHVELNKI
ncbi:MAG: CoA-binding protein [Clostridium sp.]|uniref:CoA-binding protein n=1 Tax=Clostridium sp. TaxID=1506 RepID=UPI00302DB2C7